MKYKLLFLLIGINLGLKAQNKPEYAIGLIPELLKKNASAVMREDLGTYEVRSAKDVTHKTRQVITILKTENPYKAFYFGYDKHTKIKTLKARYYDATGKLIRKVEKDEINDLAGSGGGTLYTDYRVKRVENEYGVLPYTFEIECEEQISSFMQFSDWYFQNFGASVEVSRLEISVPKDYKIFHRVLNSDLKPTVTTEKDGRTVYQWQQANLSAIENEPFSPASSKILAHVEATPEHFSYYDVEGDMGNWEKFAAFEAGINRNRDKLSTPMVDRVKSMTENCKTNREKIDTLYHYLQNTMRYVSVQLGIGGHQTFNAEYVEKNKYGDCKALSNFMKALLKSADIESQLAFIFAGSERVRDPDPDFCFDQFNHCVLYVPTEKMWLECTSDNDPTGYVSTFTQNRGALVYNDFTGKLIRTPALDTTTNVETTKSVIQMAADGSAVLKNYSLYTGSLHDDLRTELKNLSKENLQKRFQQHKKLPSFKIEKLEGVSSPNKPEATLTYDLSFDKFGAKAGSRFIVPINADNAFDDTPPPTEKRNLPIEAGGTGYTQTIETTLNIPEGYEIEALPTSKIEMTSVYGSYFSTIEKGERSVTFKRRLVIKPVSQPAEKFNEFRDFYKKMEQADNVKVILKKSEIDVTKK